MELYENARLCKHSQQNQVLEVLLLILMMFVLPTIGYLVFPSTKKERLMVQAKNPLQEDRDGSQGQDEITFETAED
jgi:hypothetical protein